MHSNTLQAKQQYLRQKIIEGGHDAQKFVQFCSQKHNLDDLENWSLHQLIDIVQAFLNTSTQKPSKEGGKTSEQLNTNTSSSMKQVENPIKPPTQNNKLGLVLNQDDWSMFLSAPSILNTEKDKLGQNQTTGIDSLLTLDLNFAEKQAKTQQYNSQQSSKDIPLSPPSIQNKQKSAIVPQGQKRQTADPIIEQIKFQKKNQKKSYQASSPINLSNIIIKTAKEKALPPLPNITQVTVVKTEQVSRNFLQGDYTLYHINFSPCQITIQRKFSDLLKLRSILRRLFPFLRLPYLEPEGWLSASEGKDPQNLSRYKWMVQQFIRYVLIKSDELKNCEVVRFFCGFTKKQYSKQEFRKKLEAYEGISRPKFMGQVILSTNIFLIPPTLGSDKFCTSTVSLINQIDVQYDKLRRQLDTLFLNYNLLLKSYSEIGSTFENIQNLINKHNTEDNTQAIFGAFDGLKEITQRMTNKMLGEYKIFKNRIKNMFRFQKDNMTTIRQVIEFSTSIRNQFSRQGSPSLSSNKLKGSDMEIQSNVPLQDPIKNNKPVLAVQQIFWAFACKREANRYWELLRKKINQCLTLIAYDQLDSQNENLNFWNGIIKRSVI